ncbi:DUF3450 domain-containing protein [Vibrio sp. JC009]|uniref:DUF3450 domain-containing protein n=1 Tax=Vibrio sp. JC009 TaxID=2912314 RepID=UPI0023AF9505|nr:DUF3450 domain-containing protein [Vibrio sp. JC009]WED23345.1 DUF3450 domain-containing protein [Vibrio sp. JC009]
MEDKTMRILTLIITSIVLPVQASTLDKSANIEKAIIFDAKKSQEVVTGSSDASFDLKAEIDILRSEINNLEIYQGHLDKLIESQNQELSGLDLQLEEITDTRQSVIPLMYEMLDGLEAYVEQDMPIRKQTRTERINKLKKLMTESGVSDAEKYRRILEAYQIELDYVTKFGTYTSLVEINGVSREVEQLYLGHISFIARSLDHRTYWYWSQEQQHWVALEAVANTELDKAFSVANKLASPSLLMLPLSALEINQ